MSNDSVASGDRVEGELPSLDQVFTALPLVERDHYFGMQALNLAIVDGLIEQMESDLYAEYIVEERTPLPSLMRVSALSQLWIFGAYELMRTWRQRVVDVLRFEKRTREMAPDALNQELKKIEGTEVSALEMPPYRESYAEAVRSPAYAVTLRQALYRSELPFRKIEAVRVHLAKHEVPRSKKYGSGAGYTRIDFGGSPQFHVPLGNNQVELVSRQQIAEALKRMPTEPLFVIEEQLAEVVSQWPTTSYGVRTARIILNDGREFEAAIAWNRHIVWVRGYDAPPFEASQVADVRPVTTQE